jgi:hypothetical protein
MCLLIVCEPNSTPKATDLHAGACSNPHGFGFAIHTGDRVISERSMSAKKSIKRFLELRAQYPAGYAMWHARYATHGVKNEQNCHPFIVGGDERTYLAHNGVLDVAIPANDRRSDTRVFAEDTLPKLGGVSALDDETIWSMISKWASGSKIAVLTADPSAQYPMYLVNEDLGKWDDEGIWWSNQSHIRSLPKPAPTTYYAPPAYTPAYTAWSDDNYYKSLIDYENSLVIDSEIDECIYCQTIVDVDENPYYCQSCELCYDCGTNVVDCLCWMPNWRSKRDLGHLL